MRRKFVNAIMATTLLLDAALGCAKQINSADNVPGYVACPERRPAMCTKEYRPVCGKRDTGIRCITTPCPSEGWRQYGNKCDACADGKVYGYVPQACDGPENLEQ